MKKQSADAQYFGTTNEKLSRALRISFVECVVRGKLAEINETEHIESLPDMHDVKDVGNLKLPWDITFQYKSNNKIYTMQHKNASERTSEQNGVGRGTVRFRHSHKMRKVELSTQYIETVLLPRTGPMAPDFYAIGFSKSMHGNWKSLYVRTKDLPSSKHHSELIQETIAFYSDPSLNSIYTTYDLESLLKKI